MGGHRTFTDSAGTAWEVWEVVPSLSLDAPERRRAERRGAAATEGGPERRLRQRRLGVAGTVGTCWLVFRSADERRRLRPVPAGWTEVSDVELERLCGLARAAGPRR